MTLGTEVTSCRDLRQYLAVAVHEMGDADHRRLEGFGIGAGMAQQAAIGVLVDLITVDAVRAGGRLLGPGALAAAIGILHLRHRRRRGLPGSWAGRRRGRGGGGSVVLRGSGVPSTKKTQKMLNKT